jgi:hypothetical protein
MAVVVEVVEAEIEMVLPAAPVVVEQLKRAQDQVQEAHLVKVMLVQMLLTLEVIFQVEAVAVQELLRLQEQVEINVVVTEALELPHLLQGLQ